MSSSTEKSTDNDTPTKEEVKGTKQDPFDEKHEKIIVITILILGLAGIFLFVVGVIWSIKDIISEDVWSVFVAASIQSKLFWIGLILLGVFFLLIFLYVLYKRGIRAFAGYLFKEKPTKALQSGEEYIPAKIMTLGGLISVFAIFLGLIIASIQFFFQDQSIQGITSLWDTVSDMPGGIRILIISVIVLILDTLIYGFIYIWMNGQWVIVNKILKYNRAAQIKYDFSHTEKIVGRILFSIIVAEICMVIFGIVWAIVDAITGNWSIYFKGYPFGVKFSFYGIYGSLLFAILVGMMFIYKRGLNLIMIPLFVQISPRKDTSNIMAKIITIGFLSGIVLIAVGLISWIVSWIIEDINIGSLSDGFALLIYGVIAFVFTCLALLFSFALHNGYSITMNKILKIEEKLDEGFEEMAKKKKQ